MGEHACDEQQQNAAGDPTDDDKNHNQSAGIRDLAVGSVDVTGGGEGADELGSRRDGGDGLDRDSKDELGRRRCS